MIEIDNAHFLEAARKAKKPSAPVDEVRRFETGAVRSKDADATRYDLISPIALEEIAKTYAEGASKYNDHNWLRGMPVHDLLNHAIRHVYLFLSGDRSEPHLPHAAWGLMAAIHSHKQWPHLNDGHLLGPGCSLPNAKPAPAPAPTEFGRLSDAVNTIEPIEPDGFAAAFEALRRNSESSDSKLADIMMSIDFDDGDGEAARAALSDVKEHGTIPWEQIKVQLSPGTEEPFASLKIVSGTGQMIFESIPGTAAEIASRRPRPVLYLSGPMSGIDDFNFPAFRAAARKLRDKGYPVIDPSDYGCDPAISWASCLSRDLAAMGHADVIVTLPGWEYSKGASLETDVARRLFKAQVSYGDLAAIL